MVLKNFGHGQTLEWFEHNSKAYFWVTCKANEAYDFKWGTQIGRIQYKPTDKKGIDYTEIPRFSHMSYANKSGTSIGEVKRVDAALSSNGKKICFTASAVKAACYGSFRQSGSNRVLPNGSCQGLEFSDGDSIYIIGGAAGQKPGIAKLTGSGSSYKYSCLVTATHNNFGGNAESEGIQLKGDYVYFGISDKQSSDKACIYSIPKSAF